MAVWELIRDAMETAHSEGKEWLKRGEIVTEVLRHEPTTNKGSIAADVTFHCINDPSKKHSPGLRWRVNPLLITDAPTAHGKRYRLLSEAERTAFLGHVCDDLDKVSYVQALEWLANPSTLLQPMSDEIDEPLEPELEEIAGLALFELHLQDYIHRHWGSVFPDLQMYQGGQGREFRTSDPRVGILDFLAKDSQGNFVVLETKRDMPDRKAVGQILSYMGWVDEKLCTSGQTVRGILIAGDASPELKLAVRAVPNLSIQTYEISFALTPLT